MSFSLVEFASRGESSLNILIEFSTRTGNLLHVVFWNYKLVFPLKLFAFNRGMRRTWKVYTMKTLPTYIQELTRQQLYDDMIINGLELKTW